jgi:hypothetical protein
MYFRLYNQLILWIHFGFKVFKAIVISLHNVLHFTIFGQKSDHVRISTRYLGLTSVVLTTRTGG